MKHRSTLLALGAALSAVTLLAACGGGSSSASGSEGGTTKVTFGYIGDFNGSSLLAVADQEGLWKKHHLDVSTKVFTNGPLQIQALGTGDLDFGYIGRARCGCRPRARPRSSPSTPWVTRTG